MATTTCTTTKTNDAALTAYIAAQHQAHALLAQLTAQLNAHQDSLHPDEVHWGHVGDIKRIIGELNDLVGETE